MKPSKKRFEKINVEISNICNLQCSFCPEIVRAKKLIELPLFRRVIEQVAPLTEQVTFHLMGDPLVHPRLEELVAICAEHQVKIFLVTNGVLLREKQANLLLDSAFRQVNFSLHSFFDNHPDRDPTSYLERIFDFTDRALRERPDLYLNFRLWNLADPRGAQSQNKKMLEKIEEHYGRRLELPTDIRQQKSIPIQGRLFLHLDTEFTWPSPDLPILGEKGTCLGLRSHIGILVDGTVVPCCLDQEGRIPLGNIAVTPLTEILEQPRAMSILKGFRERKLVEDLCQRCSYIERFS
jgi:MoaA/NifB/PqqE/SkfB family radical SAM enzyme